MVKQHYKFSIITPVYNRVDCITRCINSVLLQDYENWEHIIVDDGSTDGTDLVIEKAARQHEQLKFIKLNENQGTNAARNEALNNVSGDFVIFLDSDDFLNENVLKSVCEQINENSGFEYFLFAVSDRVDYYLQHPILKSHAESVVTYSDWLTGSVSGDFVHVVSAKVWKNNRFCSKYRIYEELTFMELYKQTGKQLFCNKVVICRERDRKDSVSYEASLYKPNSILFSKEVLYLILQSHFQGYLDCHEVNALEDKLNKLYLYTLMLGQYEELSAIEQQMKICGGRIKSIYLWIKTFRLGKVLSWGVRLYSFIKHKIKD